MTKITVEIILNTMEQWVADKQPIAPSKWIDAAQKIVVLMGNEYTKLHLLEKKVAEEKIRELEKMEKPNVSMATMYVEASDIYYEMRLQTSRIKRIEEFVRLAKKHAEMLKSELTGQI